MNSDPFPVILGVSLKLGKKTLVRLFASQTTKIGC